MTSSNVASTGEGRTAAAKASPPLSTATSAAVATTEADASGAAAATTVLKNHAEPSSNPDALENLTPSKAAEEASVAKVAQHFTLADLPGSQLQSHQISHETSADMPILSPPTVSPLSTPAATNVNVDEGLPDEVMAKLAADLPPLSLTRDASMFRSDIFGPQQSGNAKGTPIPEAMEIDEPYGPEETNFHRRDQLQAIATTDPDPHAAEYSSHGMLRNMRLSQGSIDPSAYMMNLAAQATLFHDHGPPVIDPSAVSLHSLTQDSEAFTGSGGPASVNDSQKLESFAKIEFADSTFQMTTYAVIIGRDQQAMAQARADERREAIYRRKCEENERNGLPPPTPVMHDRGKFSKSYVSEEGGMLGPEHSDGEDMKPVKKRRQSSVAQYAPGEDNVAGDHVQSNRQYVSHTPGAAAVDMSVLQPSPGHIPFIGIHSPGPDIASKTRGISRQHLKIQFNKKRGVFEGIALHKNGFFCEDILYGLDTPATLRSGDRLQIKDVEFFFVINGVQIGMSGGEDEDITSSKRMSIGGKEMSLDFEHSDHENFRDTSEELSDVENIPTPNNEFESSDGEPEQAPAPAPAPTSVAVEESRLKAGLDATAAQPVNEGEQPPEIVKTENEIPAGMSADIPHEFAIPDIPRRRGPGRPPKDGIMSKRERRLLKKQMQETSKKALPQDPQEEKIKRPVGRPRKNPLPEDGEQPEKRKYNKKKREDGDGGSDVEKRIKEKKDKKVRPKSPPLDLRREDYTAEQLQKPTKNYGVLIDEALTNGPPDGLTLKQIYKRITAKYPWFFFTAETKGWESSVRHNLIGNEAFKKDEETGLWSRVPGVELDAGKKRKVSSPDRHLGPSHLHPHLSHSPYYQTSPYANPGNISYAHGLPSYSAEQKHLQPGYTSLGQNTQLHATTSQPVAQPVYTAHAPAPAQLPASYASLGLSRPSSTPQQSTYSSPYARPPPPTNPPAKADANLANSQNPIASTTPATSAQQPQPKLNAASTGPREQLTPEIERAIVQFSANMLEVISERTPHAASIIEAAANRIRGLPVQNRVPGFESVETTLVNAMQVMIKDMKRSHHNAAASSPAPSAPVQTTSTPGPAPPNTVEAEIQRRLRNFRESMVTALKTKTDKAEIVVDSAINRARGLPHAGKIPGWEEADNLMVKSVTQIIAEARSAYNLKFQNSSPIAASSSRTAPSLPAQSVLRREAPATSASALTASTSSAAPVPPTNGTPATPHAASVHPSISGVPNSHSMARPGLPLQRPAPVALTRAPTAGPIARPTTVLHKEPTTTPAIVSAATLSTVSRPNVSTPAPPSAGVLDQITGQKRFIDDAFHKNHGVSNTTNNHTSSNTSVSSNVVNNSCNNITNNPSVTKVPPSGPTPSSMTGTTVGKEVGNITSTTTVSAASGFTNKPARNASGSFTSKPAGSAPSSVPSISGSAPSHVVRTPTSNTLSNAMSIPTSSMPNTMSHATTTSISNHATSITNSRTNSHVSTMQNSTNVNTAKSNATSSVSGDTSKFTADGLVNTTANTTGKASASEHVTTDNVNHATATASSNAPESTTYVPANLTPGFTRDSITAANKGDAAGGDCSTVTGALAGETTGTQTNRSIEESANAKVETEKSTSINVVTTENYEATALKMPAPIPKVSSPAPPSAGVVDQIAGQKRSIDEGPGSANEEQPEPKRLGVPLD